MAKTEYSALSLEDPDESARKKGGTSAVFNYDSAFDFRSIAKFDRASFPSKSFFTFSKQKNSMMQKEPPPSCLDSLVSGLLLALVYALALATLPLTGWWTLRRLQRWQRLVVFRLGRALPPRGPGWTLLLPGIDTYRLVDLRNQSILVPPQQLITCDAAVVELGAEVRYRVCDPHAFVGSCVDPQGSLRSLARTIMVNTLVAHELSAITKKVAETEETVLLSINSQLKDWGMEASSVKFSEVKVHREAEQLSAVGPVLRQLGSMLGGGGTPLVAGQPPLTASWPAAASPLPPAAATAAPLAADAETAGVLRAALERLPAGPDAAGLARGVYRIETTEPDGVCHVVLGDGGREVRAGLAPELAADVTVTLSAADLHRLAAGELSPLAAYSGGRLRARGNVHLLMALGSLLKEAGEGADL